MSVFICASRVQLDSNNKTMKLNDIHPFKKMYSRKFYKDKIRICNYFVTNLCIQRNYKVVYAPKFLKKVFYYFSPDNYCD